jgi:hypothetical protein
MSLRTFLIKQLGGKPAEAADTSPESEERCPVCANDKLLDVTAYGDKERKLLCGECGWHSDRAKTSS